MFEAEIYSEKWLSDILKALESNSCKLVQEVALAGLKRLSRLSKVDKIDDERNILDGELSNQKNEQWPDKTINLTSDNSKLKPNL